MIGTLPEMRALTHDLATSVWTLASIGALLESGLATHLREPHSVEELAALCPALPRSRMERCLAVAAAVGVVAVEGACYRLAPGALPFAQPPLRAALEGAVRSDLMQALAFLDASSASGSKASKTGWTHTDPVLLHAQGNASGGFPPMMKANLVGTMGDLAARLEQPGGRFLDVGVGVAALAIAMCRTFPHVRVVGLDVFDVPLGLARENIAHASLADRIELRRMAVEDLREEDAFDLAWLPTVFIPAAVLPSATARVRASLRPGGWILFPLMSNPAGDDRQRAVSNLVNELWGGPVLSSEEAEALLKAAGFSSTRVVPGPAWAPVLVLGQR